MTRDIEAIRDACRGLEDLVISLSCGCVIQEDPTLTLDFVAELCGRFLEEYDEYQKRRKEVCDE